MLAENDYTTQDMLQMCGLAHAMCEQLTRTRYVNTVLPESDSAVRDVGSCAALFPS